MGDEPTPEAIEAIYRLLMKQNVIVSQNEQVAAKQATRDEEEPEVRDSEAWGEMQTALTEAHQIIEQQKEILDGIGSPPNTFGTLMAIEPPAEVTEANVINRRIRVKKNIPHEGRFATIVESQTVTTETGQHLKVYGKFTDAPNTGQYFLREDFDFADGNLGNGSILLHNGKDMVKLPYPFWIEEEFKVGDVMLLHPMTGAPVALADSLPDAGEITSVRNIINEQMVEVEINSTTRVVFAGKFIGALKVGDRIILNDSGLVVMHNLGRGEDRWNLKSSSDVTWDTIGGLEAAKQTMREAVELPLQFKELYAQYGKKPIKGVLLYGPPGCVDGDAEVTLNRAGKGYKTTLKDLYKKFNGITEKNPVTGRRYKWDPTIPTFIRCLHEGELRLQQVVGVFDKGVKSVLRMTLADGKQLLLTPDHEVKTAAGYRRADSFSVGELVYTNGTYVNSTDGYEYQCSGLKHHPRARKTQHGGYELAKHILVIEAELNGLSFDEYMECVSGNKLNGITFADPENHVHHKDGVRTNNTLANLELQTRSEHSKEHELHKNLPIFMPKEVAISNIEEAGELQVYDVTVANAHNFVANGIVVHNCGKTMLGKAAASSIAEIHGGNGGAFMYIKGPELLNKWVGETEAQIRSIFAAARAYKEEHGVAPIIFIDEADAILSKRGSGVSSDMEKTMVPMFLAEMDGLDDAAALVILATNRSDKLDSAVVRDGRVDRKIKVTRPTQASAAEIFRLSLRSVPLQNGHTVEELSEFAAKQLFDGKRELYELRSKGGDTHKVCLHHAVNGGMVVGTVDQATSLAISRDMAEGTATGITKADLAMAVNNVYLQNADLDHQELLIEFAEDRSITIDAVRPILKGGTNG